MADLTLEERVAKLEAQVARWKAVEFPTLDSLTTQIRTDIMAMKEDRAKGDEKMRRNIARRR